MKEKLKTQKDAKKKKKTRNKDKKQGWVGGGSGVETIVKG